MDLEKSRHDNSDATSSHTGNGFFKSMTMLAPDIFLVPAGGPMISEGGAIKNFDLMSFFK